MKRALLVAALIGLSLLASGCTTKIAADYPQYLKNNLNGYAYPQTNVDAAYEITPETMTHTYKLSAASAGAANSWVVEFGKMLDATLQAEDVKSAFGSIEKTQGLEKPLKIVFHLEKYEFSGFQAKVSLKATITRNGQTHEKIYSTKGVSQGAKVFWGGAPAFKNAVQQSTKNSIDQILSQILTDLKA